MVEQILPYFEQIFASCAAWTSSLLEAVGGKGVVLAAFSVVLAISLLFLPMRGRMGATSFVGDYQQYSRHAKSDEYRKQHMEYHKGQNKKG